MASTNKTTNYELSQYIGSDKPTYLTDYNQDMSKIDAGIHAAKSEADTNSTSIGTLSNLTTDTKSSLVGAINEVDGHADTNASNIATNTSNIATNTTHIGTLTNLTTASKTDLVVAANEINAKVGDISALNTTVKSSTVAAINELLDLITLVNIKTYDLSATSADIEKSNINSASGNITIATNADGSIFKIYSDTTSINHAAGASIRLKNTGINPESSFTINGGCVGNNINGDFRNTPFTVDTNGDIVIDNLGAGYGSVEYRTFIACLYFAKDFGDVPEP